MIVEERIQELVPLQRTLGYTFKDQKLLNKALTHKSYANEIDIPVKHNERFEFLGDSVLDLIISEYMVREFGDLAEGALSKIRAAVVNESGLAELARKMDLGSYLLLGKGENLSGGRKKPSILANSYEALVGALFIDSDLGTVARVLMPTLIGEIDECKQSWNFRDYKSDLQEYTQNKLACIPVYEVIGETGPDHDKRFEIKVTVRDEVRGTGSGRSKKEAEQNAAQVAVGIFFPQSDRSNEK